MPGLLRKCAASKSDELWLPIKILSEIARNDLRQLPLIRQALKSQSAGLRLAAARALGRIGMEPNLTVPYLADALFDDDVGVQIEAAEALGHFGPAASEAVGPMRKLLETKGKPEDRAKVPVAVAEALGKIGGASAVGALVSEVERVGGAPVVRQAAIRALGSIGAAAAEAVPALSHVLSGMETGLHAPAAETLGKMAPCSREAIPVLTRSLSSRDTQVREAAATALGAFGPEARGAIPALLDVLTRDQDSASRNAAQALGAVGPEALVPLTEAAKSGKRDNPRISRGGTREDRSRGHLRAGPDVGGRRALGPPSGVRRPDRNGRGKCPGSGCGDAERELADSTERPEGTAIYPFFGIDRTNGPELGPRERIAGRLTRLSAPGGVIPNRVDP